MTRPGKLLNTISIIWSSLGRLYWRMVHGPLARYVNLRVLHAPGMTGMFSQPSRVCDSDIHHGQFPSLMWLDSFSVPVDHHQWFKSCRERTLNILLIYRGKELELVVAMIIWGWNAQCSGRWIYFNHLIQILLYNISCKYCHICKN